MSSVQNSGVLWSNFSPSRASILYYPYLIPACSQYTPLLQLPHDPAIAQISSMKQEKVNTNWRSKRQTKSPRASQPIATPPYTPPGSRPPQTSEMKFEILQKRSDEILRELKTADQRLEDMEGMIKRRLYDIVLRQYTRQY